MFATSVIVLTTDGDFGSRLKFNYKHYGMKISFSTSDIYGFKKCRVKPSASSVIMLTRNVTDGQTDILKVVQNSITNILVRHFFSTSDIYGFRKVPSKSINTLLHFCEECNNSSLSMHIKP